MKYNKNGKSYLCKFFKNRKKKQRIFFPKRFDLPQQRHFCLHGDYFVGKPNWQLSWQKEEKPLSKRLMVKLFLSPKTMRAHT